MESVVPEHIVDRLIEERLGSLLRIPLLSPLMMALIKPLMKYQETLDIIDGMRAQPDGHQAMQFMVGEINVDARVIGKENIPAQGSALLVSNHPSGISDGVALYEQVREVRDDIMLIANKDALRAVPSLEQVIIPVEWREEHRTYSESRATALGCRRALKAGKLLLIFPSGRLAYKNKAGVLTERKWNYTAVRLAQKYNLPLCPVHIDSRNSWLFYFISKASERIRDVTVFREAFNKFQARYPIKFGTPIAPELLVGDDPKEITDRIKSYVTSSFADPLQLPMRPDS